MFLKRRRKTSSKWAVYSFAELSGPRGRQLGGTAVYTSSLKLMGKSEKLVLVVTMGPWRHEVLGSDPERVGKNTAHTRHASLTHTHKHAH